jgi:hypothetical protein
MRYGTPQIARMSSPSTKSQVRRLLVSYEAVNAGSAPTSGVARDAALGGLFIETTSPFPIGTLLTVELTSPRNDSAKVTLEGRVFSMRTTPEGSDRPAGMGVRFLDLPASMMMQLQSILDHHRPPARTQLGVGDEKEALWQAAGGRDDDLAPSPADQDGAVALAGAVVVDGRPTFEPLPPSPPPQAPEEPRYPTPRMLRAVPPAPPSSQPSSLSAHMLPATPPSIAPASMQPPLAMPARKTGSVVVIVVAVVILVLFALAVGATLLLWRWRSA